MQVVRSHINIHQFPLQELVNKVHTSAKVSETK